MKRTRNWRNCVLVVMGIFLPLLALGCNSAPQTKRPWAWEMDRTGTAYRILFPNQAWDPPKDRRAVVNEAHASATRPAVAEGHTR